MPPKAFLFDVFGTTVDWRTGVATETDKWFAGKQIDLDPFDFADQWRGKYQPAMERIRTGNRGYVALDVLHRENLQELLADLGISDQFSEDETAQFSRAWEKLPAWPDTVSGLKRLRSRAIIAPCSNGSIALMTHLARFAELPWDCILGAEIAQDYKPKPAAYLKSVAALQLAPSQVAMVAAHNDDLIAARACGLQTVFIPRPNEHGANQTSDLHATSKWSYIVDSFEELSGLI